MDYLYMFVWWLFFFLLGLLNFPLTFLLLGKNFDRGYGLSKFLGLFFVSLLLFTGSALKILPFNPLVSYLSLGTLLIINILLFLKYKKRIVSGFTSKLKVIFFQEVLFFGGLTFWAIIKTYNPEIRSLEKFMDFGFINAILRSDWQPAQDIWFAGKGINYYYFGHFYSAVATRLTQIPSFISYNLMIATILGFLINGAFSFVSTAYHLLPNKINKKALSAGIISLLLVAFAGNLHTPIYAFRQSVEKYWYPDATRFIGYNPETEDKTIHEFPLYSFVVSDLHAHLLGVPIVVAYLSFLLQLVFLPKDLSLKKRFLKLLVPGMLLGAMFMTNTWDFASYLLTTGVVLLVSEGKQLTKKAGIISTIFITSLNLVILIILGLLFALPFILNFESIAQGIKMVSTHSPFWQLAILWGLPLILITAFSIFLLSTRGFKKIDLFIFGLLISSIILIIVPEVVYVKDIYIASHYRANTMFKITYQAFVISYLTGGYVALRIITKVKTILLRVILTTFFTLLFSALLSYPFFAVNSYYNKLKERSNLNGTKWLQETYPSTYNAVQYLNKNVKGQPIIAEAPGNSYTDFNVISSYTGLPTVQGWFVHEWLWRGSAQLPSERNSDLGILFTSLSEKDVTEIINKYNIEYIIVGQFEKEKYPELTTNVIGRIAKIVFAQEDTVIYQVKN